MPARGSARRLAVLRMFCAGPRVLKFSPIGTHRDAGVMHRASQIERGHNTMLNHDHPDSLPRLRQAEASSEAGALSCSRFSQLAPQTAQRDTRARLAEVLLNMFPRRDLGMSPRQAAPTDEFSVLKATSGS